MNYKILLVSLAFGVLPISAEEPKIQDLLQRIEILEEKVEELNRRDAALDLEVPDVTSSRGEKKDQIIVHVLEHGSIQVNNKKMTEAELINKLIAVVALMPDQSVRIQADKKVEYEMIVKTIVSCSKAGIWNITFSTNNPQNKTR